MKTRTRRGGAALEFALTVPLLLGMLLGGFHFTRALVTRIRMGDIAAYAARAAVANQKTDTGAVQGFVNSRLQGTVLGNCAGGVGVSSTVEQLYPQVQGQPPNAGKALVVTLRCTTESKNLLGKWLLPSQTMVVAASYPY